MIRSSINPTYSTMVQLLTSIWPLLQVTGPFNEVPEEYSFADACEALTHAKVLVVGAGGLGSEILKNLALTGFKHIEVIDMDTVDVSNLNRQFLFRDKDVGRPKSETAAKYVLNRMNDPTLRIIPHFCKIQDQPAEFYKQFTVVVCGLDNIEARRWINALLVGFVGPDLSNLIPLIDGGTEGFRGQSRVILPTLTSCFECSLDMISPKTTYPVCTIANTPRLPEHCIEWASQLEWPRRFPGRKFDADKDDDVDLMYQLSLARATEFGIENVTRSLTLGVVKNIIPAIASTNAIVAASCCNEAFKVVTSCNPALSTYMMYSGDDSIFTYTFSHTRNTNCSVCSTGVKRMRAKRWWTVARFLEELATKQDILAKAPSVSSARVSLYMRQPAFLETQTRENLLKKLSDLVQVGEELVITDPSLPVPIRLVLDLFEGSEQEPLDLGSLLQ